MVIKYPIYLDYNATTPILPEVYNAMLPYLSTEFWNPSSSHPQALKTTTAIAIARKQVAELLNCLPEEIFFTSGGTESNNMALLGITNKYPNEHKQIISSTIEHPAIKNVLIYLENKGNNIHYTPVDSSGCVILGKLSEQVSANTSLISIMYANNEVGTIQPIKDIAKLAHKFNIPFHTDASQAIGKVNCDVQDLKVDLLTMAGHKLYAPKGIGALFVKKGIKLENLMHGAGQENGLRPGTENVAYIVGLGKACEIAKMHLEKEAIRLKKLTKHLFWGLKQKFKNDLVLNGDAKNRLPNTLNISIKGVNGNKLMNTLENKVLFSTGAACHSGEKEVSEVLSAMSIAEEIGSCAIRLSIGKLTTTEEIDQAITCICDAAETIKAR